MIVRSTPAVIEIYLETSPRYCHDTVKQKERNTLNGKGRVEKGVVCKRLKIKVK